MRIIAGSARGKKLVCPAGSQTRPTTDRIKETLFNILQQDVPDCRFLDLFSGSGGIGLEALSRGAAEAVFVEKDRPAVSCIEKNIKNTGFGGRAQVMAMDVMRALNRLEQCRTPFHLIFLDPPYEKGFEEQVLPFLAESALVQKDTRIILETTLVHGAKICEGGHLPWEGRFALERYKKYKSNSHVFYRVV